MGALYAAYSDLFPTAQELWRTLSSEEYGHAALLRSLPKQTDELAAFLDARRFRLDEVRSETKTCATGLRCSCAAPASEAAPTPGISRPQAVRRRPAVENQMPRHSRPE